MPLTELALLRLKPSITLDISRVRSNLQNAKHAMESFTGYPFYYYSQIEDPTLIYIIGCWESLQQHFGEWIPSEQNQNILGSLNDFIDVEWLYHYAIDGRFEKSTGESGETVPVDAPVLSIVRHTISRGERENFKKTFREVKHHVAEFTAPRQIAGGWRFDLKHGQSEGAPIEVDEFLLFTGWNDVLHHHAFAQTEQFKDYARIRSSLDHFDVKHLQRLTV